MTLKVWFDTDTIVPLVTDINDELKRYFAKHSEALYDLSPRKFEMLIADILKFSLPRCGRLF